MKTRSKILSLFTIGLITLATACTTNEQKTVPSKQAIDSSVIQSEPLSIDSVYDATNDSAVTLTVQSPDTTLVILGKLKGPQKELAVHIPVPANTRLTAALVPIDSTANIRIAHVIYPSGKAAGPFGREISIPFQKQGTCTLVVAHNLMTEAELTKLFKLHLRITRQPAPAKPSR